MNTDTQRHASITRDALARSRTGSDLVENPFMSGGKPRGVVNHASAPRRPSLNMDPRQAAPERGDSQSSRVLDESWRQVNG